MRQNPEPLAEPKLHSHSNQALLRKGRAGAAPPKPPLRPSQTFALQRKCAYGSPTSPLTGESGGFKGKKCLQAKLTVGASNDPLEHEADSVAEQVMRMPDPGSMEPESFQIAHKLTHVGQQTFPDAQLSPASTGLILQRKCAVCEEEDIQRKAEKFDANAVSSVVDSGIRDARGSGEPMSNHLRSYFEPRFGMDFGGVRLHSDSRSASLATAVAARAFTIGNDIFFAAGQYQPGTSEGRHLLAHELTHTIQQGQGSANLLQREVNSESGKVADAETTDEDITEEDAKKEIEGVESIGSEDLTPEETEAAGNEEEKIDKQELREEVAAASDVETEETEVPDFDMQPSGGSPCVKLWDEEPAKEEAEGEEELAEELFAKLMSFSSAPSTIGGFVASNLWKALPLSLRAAAIDKAIDAALRGVALLPGEVIVGAIWPWFQAGLEGFLTKMRSVSDEEKVTLFEKIGSIVLGLNTKAQLGFVIGAVKGFFLDGLLGIVQMILDLICFIPKALKFMETFANFLTNLPDHMEAAWQALMELVTAIKSAIGGALGELKDLITNPARIAELAKIIFEAGKSKSKEIGEMFADTLLNYARLPAKTLGEKAGRLVGSVAFEAVVTYLTAGAEAGISALKIGVKEALRWVFELGKKFFEIVGKVLPFLEDIANVVVRVAKYLSNLFKMVCDKLNQAIQRIIDFFRSILGLCEKGSFKCKFPKRHSRKPPADKTKCRGRFVPRAGGNVLHDAYARRVTGRAQDFRIVLGKVRRCNFDAKVVNMLVECKTGHGWLVNPTVQAKPWFPFVIGALRAQSLRCLATAVSCGYSYVWYMQNKAAAAYLNTIFGGIPPVIHKP